MCGGKHINKMGCREKNRPLSRFSLNGESPQRVHEKKSRKTLSSLDSQSRKHN